MIGFDLEDKRPLNGHQRLAKYQKELRDLTRQYEAERKNLEALIIAAEKELGPKVTA